MKAGALAGAVLLAVAGTAGAELRAPVRVSLEGVAGATPGLSAAAVSSRWGVALRPSYEVRPDCGETDIHGVTGLDGSVAFTPRDRFGAVFLDRGAVTGRGIRIGSTLAEVRRAYRPLASRPSRLVPGTREYFARRRAAPRWELRFDVDRGGRVRRIGFGTHAAVRMDEGCA